VSYEKPYYICLIFTGHNSIFRVGLKDWKFPVILLEQVKLAEYFTQI